MEPTSSDTSAGIQPPAQYPVQTEVAESAPPESAPWRSCEQLCAEVQAWELTS